MNQRKKEAIERALLGCIEVPFNLEKKSASLWPHIRELAPIYNLETKSDLLVGIKCLETGIFGAYQNVLINMKGYNGNNERVNRSNWISVIILSILFNL